MSAFFEHHLSRINSTAKIATVTYLGAGKGGPAVLEACLASGARHILLTEPDPAQARDITRRGNKDSRLILRQSAISGQTGQQPFYTFNMHALSSLRKPTGLKEVFPGLREIGSSLVETMTMTEVLDSLPLEQQGLHILAIDCPGEEGEIIAQLLQNPKFSAVSHIFLNAMAEVSYAGAEIAPVILETLYKDGWGLVAQDDQDPDFPIYLLHLDPLTRKVSDLQKEIAAQKAKNSALVNDKGAAADRDILQNQLVSAQNNLSVALQLQTLRTIDLNDLQTRYADLLTAKDNQDALLRGLLESLRATAKYLDTSEKKAANPSRATPSTRKKPAARRPKKAMPPDV